MILPCFLMACMINPHQVNKVRIIFIVFHLFNKKFCPIMISDSQVMYVPTVCHHLFGYIYEQFGIKAVSINSQRGHVLSFEFFKNRFLDNSIAQYHDCGVWVSNIACKSLSHFRKCKVILSNFKSKETRSFRFWSYKIIQNFNLLFAIP